MTTLEEIKDYVLEHGTGWVDGDVISEKANLPNCVCVTIFKSYGDITFYYHNGSHEMVEKSELEHLTLTQAIQLINEKSGDNIPLPKVTFEQLCDYVLTNFEGWHMYNHARCRHIESKVVIRKSGGIFSPRYRREVWEGKTLPEVLTILEQYTKEVTMEFRKEAFENFGFDWVNDDNSTASLCLKTQEGHSIEVEIERRCFVIELKNEVVYVFDVLPTLEIVKLIYKQLIGIELRKPIVYNCEWAAKQIDNAIPHSLNDKLEHLIGLTKVVFCLNQEFLDGTKGFVYIVAPEGVVRLVKTPTYDNAFVFRSKEAAELFLRDNKEAIELFFALNALY